MAQAKEKGFSPSPFTLYRENLVGAVSQSIKILNGNGGVVALMKNANGKKEQNANLFAASPQLFEACYDALMESVDATPYPDGPNLSRETRSKMKDALEIALGLKQR